MIENIIFFTCGIIIGFLVKKINVTININNNENK